MYSPTRPLHRYHTLLITAIVSVAILTGCSTSTVAIRQATAIPTATIVVSPTIEVLPTVTPTPIPVDPCTLPPRTTGILPFQLPPNTIITNFNSTHGDSPIYLCTLNTTYASVSQFMLAQMQNNGWKMYNSATDFTGGCNVMTLGWIKGDNSIKWSLDEDQPYPNKEINWIINYCPLVNANG